MLEIGLPAVKLFESKDSDPSRCTHSVQNAAHAYRLEATYNESPGDDLMVDHN